MNKLHSVGENRSRIRTQRGFTLIELVIPMVIASILAAIAIPSYSAYIEKSRRTEAKSALLDLASLEERYFSTNNTYTNQGSNLGYPAGTGSSFSVGSYYTITSIVVTSALAPTSSTSVGTPATYTITAAPVAGTTQANDSACQTFVISSSGQRTATGTDPNASTDCWQ
jgi:type IV pilus assembly protein PilE